MTVALILSAPPGQANEYVSAVTWPSDPRYCQAVLPGGATATWLVPGWAYGVLAPGVADTSPPSTCRTARVPVPDMSSGGGRSVNPGTDRVPDPDSITWM